MLLPSGIAHQYSADAATPWTLYWVHYQGTCSENYTQFLGLTEPVAEIGIQPRLIADFETLLSLRHAGGSERLFVHAACQLKATLTDIACLVAASSHSRSTRMNLDQIQQLMRRHIDRDLDLDDLAHAANLSKFHFVRKFKQLTGHTPIQHFIHLRMQHACQLLDTTNESIKRVANRVGYDDPYYFSRLFKQVIGLSPQHYRNERNV